MSGRGDLSERLVEDRPLLLDGATGTELERRGAPSALPLWSAQALVHRPALVARIHADYAAAGAEAVTANTFRTQRRTLERAGLGGRAAELTTLAVGLARASDALFVLGSAPPLEDCYRPDLVPEDGALTHEHREHASFLAVAGVDGILVETMNTLREARAAVRAGRETGLPVLVSFVCGQGATLLSGEPLEAAIAAVVAEGPAAVLVNCLPPSNVAPCLPALRGSGLPWGVYANLGAPREGGAGLSEECPPEAFAECAAEWLSAGARLLGGCCGTTPEHLRALARLLR